MKKFAIAIAVVIIAIAGGLFWVGSNIDGLIKEGITRYGSEMTQARVSVGQVEIRRDGSGIIRDLSIGNPQGFKTSHALKVGEIELALDIGSVTQDVVVIRKIAIKSPDVIYEKGEAMTNFDALQKNIAAYLGPADKKSEGGKKLIVEEFTVRGAKAEASAAFMQGKTVSVPLPDITLHKLGKAKGGIPPGELGQEIVQAFKQKLGAAVSFDNVARSVGQALDKAGSAVRNLFK